MRFGRPWAAGLLADALSTADVPGSCRRSGVSLAEVRRLRETSPEFDGAWVEVDQVVRLAALENVRARAANGDLKAVRALTDGSLAALSVEAGQGGPVVVEVDREIPHRTQTVHCPGCGHAVTLHTGATSFGEVVVDLTGEFWREQGAKR